MRKSFIDIDTESNNREYQLLLKTIASLSGLFSESSIPFISYRAVENIFCRSFNALNLSRSDTAFDANYLGKIGVGIKTFTCVKGLYSTEKVAEFNALASELRSFKHKELALKLAKARNDRIDLANSLYSIEESLYHIVARQSEKLILFETDYDKIDIDNIHEVKDSGKSLNFTDGANQYSFNYSKSTLFRKFIIPQDAFELPVNIVEDPFQILLSLGVSNSRVVSRKELGIDFIYLPLYGYNKKEKYVFPKSGLNQWNAGGRARDFGEVYIPIPKYIHNKYPDFFPNRDTPFSLRIPTGEIFSAKVCQDNSKALMTNPNKALSDWLLRKLFKLEEGDILTIEKMNELGFDSVIIYKEDINKYSIDKSPLDSYENYMR